MLSKLFKKNASIRTTICGFSIIFVFVILALYAPFVLTHRTFIWRADGWTQHYPAYVFYGRWLRDIVAGSIAAGRLEIPAFSLTMGLGADIQTTLGYYVIGDPFTLLCALVPTRFMWLYYEAMILLRLYLAGIACIVYIRNKNIGSDASIAGALIYVFCGYALYAGIRHPYFINPMVYLPWLLLGVDRIFDEGRLFTFLFAVFVASLSNFYFLWMLALVTISYVIWRLVRGLIHHEQGVHNKALRAVGLALVGVLLAGVVLVPIVLLVLDSSSSLTRPWEFLRDIKYYKNFLAAFSGMYLASDWTRMGFGAVPVVSLMLLLMSKKPAKNRLILIFVILSVAMLLPAAGRIMNGFTYSSNRWEWAYAFAVAFIVSYEWDELVALRPASFIVAFLGLALYAVVSFMLATTTPARYALVQSIIALLVLVVVFVVSRRDGASVKGETSVAPSIVGIVGVVVTLCVNAWTLYIPVPQALDALYPTYGYMREFVLVGSDKKGVHVEDLLKSEAEYSDGRYTSNRDALPRLTGAGLAWNSSLLSRVSSTRSYWSLVNSRPADLLHELGVPIFSRQFYAGSSYSTCLSEILASSHLYVRSNDPVLYGYSAITGDAGKRDSANFYTNDLPLALGYCVEKTMEPEAFESYSYVERQEALMQAVMSADTFTNSYIAFQPQFDTKELTCVLSAVSDGVTMTKTSIKTTAPQQQVVLNFTSPAQSELYLSFENLDYGFEDAQTASVLVEVERANGELASSEITINAPSHQYFTGQHDFVVGGGYSEEPITKATITFSQMGTYSFDSIRAFALPMVHYDERVEKLQENMLEHIDYHMSKRTASTKLITADIDVTTSNKVLIITLPYSEGWTAFVDGEKAPIHCVNCAFMGLELTPGHHEIRLEYHTPGILIGLLCTGIGLIALMVITVSCKLKRRKLSHEVIQGAHFA